MDGLLIVITMFVAMYTILASAFSGEMKHFKRGLLLLLLIGLVAFGLHMVRLFYPWFVL